MARRWEQIGPWTGLAFVVLFVIDIAVGGSEPRPGASAARVVAWYAAHRRSVQVSDYLMAPVLVAGLFFYGHLRDSLAERSPGLAATAFGGAVLFAVSGAIGSGLQLALADSPRSLSLATAHSLNVVDGYGPAIAVAAGAATLLFGASLAILRTARLPAWIGWLGLLCGVVALVPMRDIGPLPAGIWTLIVSLALVVRRSEASALDRPHRAPAPSRGLG